MRADRSVLFNLSAAAIAEVGTKAAQFGAVVLIARALGPSDFGVVAAAWALFQLALPIVQSAPELVGIRNLSADRENGVRWVFAVGTLKLALAVATAVGLWIYAMAIYGLHSPIAAQIMTQALVLLGVAWSPAWAARSFQRTDLYALPRLLQAFLFVTIVGAGMMFRPMPLTVPVSELVAWTIGSLYAYRILRRLLTELSIRQMLGALPSLKAAWTAISGNGRETFYFAASGIASAAIWWVPVLMAEALFGAAAGGNVAAAVRLVTIALIAIQLGLQVFLPMLAKYREIDHERFRAFVAALAFYTTLVSSVIAVAVAALAEPLAWMAFGPGFEASVPLIVIFAVTLVPIGIASVYGYALIAAYHSQFYFFISVAGSLAILVSQFAGMMFTGSLVGVAWGLPCVVLNTIALAVYAHGSGLVGDGIYSLHRLAPRNIRLFLLER